ncbi:hypothetical protein [Neobacillus drentensis]|uniref:hypothetical protein n=1 Tax=Neobacillus drentensis TaxID=220684 RepID=UPI002FFF30BB
MENTKKVIKYIGFYDLPNSSTDRACNLAATNKMNYVCSAINRAGYTVNIISPSWMGDNTKVKLEGKNVKKINKDTFVTFCPSWSTQNKLTRNIKIAFTLIWLFIYLLLYTKRSEKVLAYHVQWISLPIRAAKFFKRFELILEVEEIYQDLMTVNSLFTKWESKLLESADAYLLSTDLLVGKFNIDKPKKVIYGVYDFKEQLVNPINDGKIHLLYAGIIDSHKKGAFNALEATKYLPENYHLHIIGFGDVEKLCLHIDEYNNFNSCKASYDGLISGDEYLKYCQSCHVGLSTQSMEGKYLESSFPSKILSYLSMGLRVVSCKISCVTNSSIGEIVTFYDQDSPEAIANAILKIDFSEEYNSIQLIRQLDIEFVEDVKQILEN